MVGMGLLMLLLGVLGLILRLRNRLYDTRWFQRFALAMGPSGLIALLAGWITTEVGRQPWVVYGVLRTADAVSPLSSQQVGTSLLIFIIVYFLVFGTGLYYMLKLMAKGPDAGGHVAGEPGHLGNEHRRSSIADRCRAPPIRLTSEALMTIDLPTIWAGIIGLVVFLYVLLDGFDLGIGILS